LTVFTQSSAITAGPVSTRDLSITQCSVSAEIFSTAA